MSAKEIEGLKIERQETVIYAQSSVSPVDGMHHQT